MIFSFLRKIKQILIRVKYSRKNNLSKIFTIGRNVRLNNCELGYHSRVAEYATLQHTKVGEYSSVGRYAKIVYTEIGKFCAISWDVTINAISHPYSNLSISAFPYVPYVGDFVKERIQTHSEVKMKNDVWVGANTVIMPGVVIGNGAIIGAGAVVTKDVPDYAIVAGVPAKWIKYRFSEEIIVELLKLKWWNWDREVIKNNIHLFQSEITEETIKKLKNIASN
jgi:acetyltransferase-like isoleucine patch superfamily enzyme